ncbi:MAG: hypothetical protein Ct9H90mP23_0090 [Methanobacteriota archaeon]|nr:MAG: hypothetical protein Ct9H90mP23_0090 [Euryarchaeota archaeon]
MDQAQVFLAAGLVDHAFAGFVLLDSESKTDGIPDWEVLEVCLADHRGKYFSHSCNSIDNH